MVTLSPSHWPACWDLTISVGESFSLSHSLLWQLMRCPCKCSVWVCDCHSWSDPMLAQKKPQDHKSLSCRKRLITQLQVQPELLKCKMFIWSLNVKVGSDCLTSFLEMLPSHNRCHISLKKCLAWSLHVILFSLSEEWRTSVWRPQELELA